jgi:hypothetical protein
MTEPLSPNPSDPESSRPQEETGTPEESNPGSVDETRPKPKKLKLKTILTPLSPHLTAPRPEEDARLGKKKTFHPSPKAVPVEPEPELTPEELADLKAGKLLSEETSSDSSTPPVPHPDFGPDEEASGEFPEEPQPAKSKKPEAPAPTQPKSRKLILALVVPAVIIVAILLLLNFLFDPFGFKIAPIEQLPDLAVIQQTKNSGAAEVDPLTEAPQVLVNLELGTVEDYMEQFKGRKLILSSTPEGLFVDSVFYEAGASINPQHGLVLESILPEEKVCLIKDASGLSYRIEVPY